MNNSHSDQGAAKSPGNGVSVKIAVVSVPQDTWDDYEPVAVKLCKVNDPDCEACQ